MIGIFPLGALAGVGTGDNKHLWLAGALNTVLFWICVAAIRHTHVSDVDFYRSGFVIIAYVAAKAILAFELLAACTALGWILMALTRAAIGEKGAIACQHPTDLGFAIAGFFVGASALGLVGTLLGLIGWLRLPFTLGIMTPLAAFAPVAIFPRIQAGVRALRASGASAPPLQRWTTAFLAIGTAYAGSLALLWKGIYPASAEGDVWEHYIPYYRHVLNSGSVAPNETWTQFWASKAAGLIHITGTLSDEFAAQLVSFALIAMAAAIVFDLLSTSLQSRRWALFGALIFIAGIVADTSVGSFIRHHAAVTAFIGYSIWIAIRILEWRAPMRSAFYVTALIVQFYCGLYLSQVVPLFGTFFGAVVVLAWLRRKPVEAVAIIGLGCAMLAGMLVEFAISYAETGIPSMISARLGWLLADRPKFENLVGTSGLIYLLYTNTDNQPLTELAPWLGRVFRIQTLQPVLIGTVAILALALITRLRRNWRTPSAPSQDMTLPLVIGLFLLVSIVPPLAFRNESTTRLYIFVNLLVPLLLLPILKSAANGLKDNAANEIALSSFLVAVSLFAIYAPWAAFGGHIRASLAYASGRLSTADALAATADFASEPSRLEFMERVRKGIGAPAKVIALTYAPGPASAFPTSGMISEPLHTLGPHYLSMIFSPPDEAEQTLRARGMNYFHLSLDAALFSGLAFSQLFRADQVQGHFKVLYRQDRQFILTWRGDSSDPLPDELVDTLELKQKAALVYPFRPRFLAALRQAVGAILLIRDCGLKSGDPGYDAACLANTDWSALALGLLRTALPNHLLPDNQQMVTDILAETDRELATRFPSRLPSLVADRLKTAAKTDTAGLIRDLIATEIVTTTQIAIFNACIKRYGRPHCEPLTYRDERIPFGIIYQNRATVSKILKLDFSGIGIERAP